MELKNVIVAVALSVLILLAWNTFFAPHLSAPPVQTSQPSPTFPQAVPSQPKTLTSYKEALAASPRSSFLSTELSGSINLKGATFDDALLRSYRKTLSPQSPHITLLKPKNTKGGYYARFGWAGRGTLLPDENTLWTALQNHTLRPGSPLTLRWNNGKGVIFEQIIRMDPLFMFSVEQRVINRSDHSLKLAPFGLVVRESTPKVLGYYILHEGLIGYIGDTLEELTYKKLRSKGNVSKQGSKGWLGITDKYWLTALIPSQKAPFKAHFLSIPYTGDSRYQADFLGTPQEVKPGATSVSQTHFFVGAKRTKLLDAYGKSLSVPKFDLAIDFGIFYFLTKPIFYAIHFFNGFLGNFGLAILTLTIFIKLLLFPLAYKSSVSMGRMKLLQPKIKLLKETYGDDRQKLSSETMALYKKEKVNPLSGCLPIFIQIPIFFSLYKVLFITIEMRQAPFFGWIHDLSAPDPLRLLTLFGLVPWDVPPFLHIINIGIWPLLMGVSMKLQQSLNPPPADPTQAKLLAFMPLIFMFFLANFSVGLVIYWTWNNVLSFSQQWLIMRHVEKRYKKH